MYKIFLFDLGLNMKKDKSELLLNSESDDLPDRACPRPPAMIKNRKTPRTLKPIISIAEWFSQTTEWWALFSVLLSELHLHFFYASLISCLHLHHWCLPFHILLNFACRACLLWSTSCATWWCGAAGGPPSPSSPRRPRCCSASGPPSSSSAAPSPLTSGLHWQSAMTLSKYTQSVCFECHANFCI